MSFAQKALRRSDLPSQINNDQSEGDIQSEMRILSLVHNDKRRPHSRSALEDQLFTQINQYHTQQEIPNQSISTTTNLTKHQKNHSTFQEQSKIKEPIKHNNHRRTMIPNTYFFDIDLLSRTKTFIRDQQAQYHHIDDTTLDNEDSVEHTTKKPEVTFLTGVAPQDSYGFQQYYLENTSMNNAEKENMMNDRTRTNSNVQISREYPKQKQKDAWKTLLESQKQDNLVSIQNILAEANQNLEQISYNMYKMKSTIRDIGMDSQKYGFQSEAFEKLQQHYSDFMNSEDTKNKIQSYQKRLRFGSVQSR